MTLHCAYVCLYVHKHKLIDVCMCRYLYFMYMHTIFIHCTFTDFDSYRLEYDYDTQLVTGVMREARDAHYSESPLPHHLYGTIYCIGCSLAVFI